MSKISKILFLLLFILIMLPFPNSVSALQLIPDGCTGPNVTTKTCGLNDIFQTFINFANFLLSIVGSVTLLMFVYGGFVWLTSGGSQDKVKKGRDIMVNTVIGIIIMLGAATVIYSVGTALCNGNQACVSQLNIYRPGGAAKTELECTKQENDGKPCGTEKHRVCSYEKSECVTECEYDKDLAAKGYSCTQVELAENSENGANAYAKANPCTVGLCPGDWDYLCCQPHESITVDKCCACSLASDPYDLKIFAQESTEKCRALCQAIANLEEEPGPFDITYDLCPEAPENRCGLPDWMEVAVLSPAEKSACNGALDDWKSRQLR